MRKGIVPFVTMTLRANSGERTRLACTARRLAERMRVPWRFRGPLTREWMFAAPRRKQHARARALPGFNRAGFSEVRAPITLPGTSFFTTKKRSLPRGILRGFTVAL